MTRVATIFLALSALVILPAASANQITITGLGTGAVQVESQRAVPFNVTLSFDANACPGGTAQAVNVALAVEMKAGGGVSASVSPTSLQFTVEASDTVGKSATYTQQATLNLAGQGLSTDVKVNATVTAKAGTVNCLTQPAILAPTVTDGSASQDVVFLAPSSGGTGNQSTEAPVPGPGLPLVALALAGLAFVLRRK